MHLNGDYDITVHAADYRGEGAIVCQLGSIKIWYKQGLDEGSNNGIRDDHKPLETIEFTIAPSTPQISLAVR